MNEAMKSEQQDKEWVFSNKSDCLSVERIDSRFFSSSVYFFLIFCKRWIGWWVYAK